MTPPADAHENGAEPFRFACVQGCTNCCRAKGYVYLTESDLRGAARRLGMSARAFERKYVYRTRHLLRLRKPQGAECHFLREKGCALHPDKPTQCRLFPFWPELTGDPKAWRDAARDCPGIGKGRKVSRTGAFRQAAQMREAYPGMYE